MDFDISRAFLNCRLCLENEGKLGIFAENSSIAIKIQSCCSLQIFRDDRLPDRICVACLATLNVADGFRSLCTKSDRFLRENILRDNDADIKKEEDKESSQDYKEIETEYAIKCDEYYTDNYSDGEKNVFDSSLKQEKTEPTDEMKSKTVLRPNLINNKRILTQNTADATLTLQQQFKEALKKTKNNTSLTIVRKSSFPERDSTEASKLSRDCKVKSEHKTPNTSLVVKKKKCIIKRKQTNDPSSKKLTKHDTDKTAKRSNISLDKPEKNKSQLCPYCGKVFKQSHLNMHLKRHNLERSFSCDVCQKTFNTSSSLRAHGIIHMTERKFLCNICKNSYKTAFILKRHVQVVHEKKQMATCKICNKVLAHNNSLRSHMMSHSGEKKVKCSICSYACTNQTTLKVHIRVHTGEKPFSCRFCDSKFAVEKSHRDHERLHTGERPYKCPVCSRGYAQLSNMKSHFKYNHKGENFDELFKGQRKKRIC